MGREYTAPDVIHALKRRKAFLDKFREAHDHMKRSSGKDRATFANLGISFATRAQLERESVEFYLERFKN